MTQDLIRRAMALVGRVPDPASVARDIMDARAKGGGVKRKRLLQDQYPTSYMPNVGRQVMADGGEAHPAWIPQRLVTSKRAVATEGETPLVDLAALKMTPDLHSSFADIIRKYPNTPLAVARKKSPDAVIGAFVDHVKDNLLALHDAVPEHIRQRSKLWYDGARAITDRWSEKYGLPDHSIAGAIAALSPQKDWYQNVSLAERVLNAMTNNSMTMTPEMENTFRRIPSLNKEKYQGVFSLLQNKALADLDGLDLSPDAKAAAKAMWIRLHDETHNDKSHPIITPEGDFAGPVLTAKGAPAKIGWGSLTEIGKAIRAIEAADDPSLISNLMGEKHKVRNFYNNILSPNSPNGDVTIDTHAVAAGLWRPLSGNSLEVAHNFSNYAGKGMPSAGGSAITGVQGLYPIYAEAYRNAARERGLLPREMQSITWEAVRGLFPDTFKTEKNASQIDAIWNRYRRGEIGQHEARGMIHEFAKGIEPPTWYVDRSGRPDEGNQRPGNPGELSGSGLYGQPAEGAFAGAGDGPPASVKKAGKAEGGEIEGQRHPALSIPGIHIVTAEAGEPIFDYEEGRRQ